jgi:hypothetical protein
MDQMFNTVFKLRMNIETLCNNGQEVRANSSVLANCSEPAWGEAVGDTTNYLTSVLVEGGWAPRFIAGVEATAHGEGTGIYGDAIWDMWDRNYCDLNRDTYIPPPIGPC